MPSSIPWETETMPADWGSREPPSPGARHELVHQDAITTMGGVGPASDQDQFTATAAARNFACRGRVWAGWAACPKGFLPQIRVLTGRWNSPAARGPSLPESWAGQTPAPETRPIWPRPWTTTFGRDGVKRLVCTAGAEVGGGVCYLTPDTQPNRPGERDVLLARRCTC